MEFLLKQVEWMNIDKPAPEPPAKKKLRPRKPKKAKSKPDPKKKAQARAQKRDARGCFVKLTRCNNN